MSRMKLSRTLGSLLALAVASASAANLDMYDTERSRWTSLLLGVNYGQVMGWGGKTWRPNFEVDYDFKDDQGNQEWVFRVAMVLLVPVPQ